MLAVYRVLHPSILCKTFSGRKKTLIQKNAQATWITAAIKNYEASHIQELGEIHKTWTTGGVRSLHREVSRTWAVMPHSWSWATPEPKDWIVAYWSKVDFACLLKLWSYNWNKIRETQNPNLWVPRWNLQSLMFSGAIWSVHTSKTTMNWFNNLFKMSHTESVLNY